MTDAIVYNSNTGFARQFAYSFAVQTGLPIYDFKDLKKLKKGSSIIYFSWIKTSKISGLDKVRKDYTVSIVGAVGMLPYTSEYIDELKEVNHLESLFYLRGGMRLYRLSITQRAGILNFKRFLTRKSKKSRLTSEEQQLLNWVSEGHENIQLDSLEPLLIWYNLYGKEDYVS